MIKRFVDRYMEGRDKLRANFLSAHPGSYGDVVKAVIEVITDDEYSYSNPNPDPERIHEIDDGDYQGTLVYVIAEKGYQPSNYWFVKVGYGSCSGCDTLESIRDYSDKKPSEKQADEYMTLALHVVQGLKKMNGDCA